MKCAHLAIAAVLVVGFLVPAAGHSAEVITPECTLDKVGALDQPTSCTSEFELTEADGKRFVSLLNSHGDFHAVTINPPNHATCPDCPASGGQGTRGTITLVWRDFAENVVTAYSCRGFAMHSDYPPTSLTRVLCDETTKMAANIALGTQTLTVTAGTLEGAPATGIRLHGRLVLRAEGDGI